MCKERNGYMLKGKTAKEGYDWWWHSFTAENDSTGQLEPFFIEYFVINPGRGSNVPQFGQIPNSNTLPSYAMIKAGKWGKNKKQIHSFHPISDFKAAESYMDVRIGDNIATDTILKGSVAVSEEDAETHSEYMTDSGSLSWDLKVEKVLSYSVGYGASKIMRALNLFEMFWHVQGMKTIFQGNINYNGQSYTVRKENSYGYQDKNWGSDFTNPWLWLNCNNFTDENGIEQPDSSLDIGGGNPKVAGIPLGAKLLGAFYHKGALYEFNFSHIAFQKQNWSCSEDDQNIYWDVALSNRKFELKVNFSCPKDGMLLINYENPLGEKNHGRLLNGGYASGNLELVEKKSGKSICKLKGSLGGCEYGSY